MIPIRPITQDNGLSGAISAENGGEEVDYVRTPYTTRLPDLKNCLEVGSEHLHPFRKPGAGLLFVGLLIGTCTE